MNRSSAVVAALVLVASGALFAENQTRAVPREFAHTRSWGRALSEFNDARIQVVAAYYYSQKNHDVPWLLIELGVLGPQAMEISREKIELVTPSGRVVPLATQARWSQDSTRNMLLLQQAKSSRHPVSSYFTAALRQTGFGFFATGSGTVRNAIWIAPNELALGDLFFESPTRLWDKGTYALIIRYDGAEAVMPIELQ